MIILLIEIRSAGLKRQKHWYLGFIGIVGVLNFTHAIGPFFGHGGWWDTTSLLWLLWFSYFIPETETNSS